MTGPGDVSRETPASDTPGSWRDQVQKALSRPAPPVTWRDYQDIVSHARHEYLAAVQWARQQREAATGPAFEEFAARERRAWFEYHEAGHAAWDAYQASQRTSGATEITGRASDPSAIYTELEARYGPNCVECGLNWRYPSPNCPHLENDVHPRTFAGYPAPARDHPVTGVRPVPQEPFFTPRPETEI